MCGINGFNWEDEALVKRMNNALRHRGPDDRGSCSFEKNGGSGVTLGQVRLSIIDLSPAGHQPMSYSKKDGASSRTHHPERMRNADVTIVFNGEIYNFQEIRKELEGKEGKGYVFSTKSDTEVILASYLEWGTGCVKRFNGMWAFAIHDRRKDILFCSRDRTGKKPFYYFHDPKSGKFIFSSELKGILEHDVKGETIRKEIDTDAIDIYLTTGYIPAPMTVYKGVHKLEARHSLILNLKKDKNDEKEYKNNNKNALKKECYFGIPGYRPVFDREKLVEEGRMLLSDSVRLRMIADVPVGAFLSGGLDSSSVVAAMAKHTDLRKLHTFSVGFEGKYDESKYMRIVKDHLGTRHHHIYYRERDFERMLERISYFYDEPYGDYSNFPTYEVSRLARERVTVSLSGDGGDEIFGGYTLHQAAARLEAVKRIPAWIRKASLALLPKTDSVGIYGQLRQALRLSLCRPEEFYAELGSDMVFKPKAFKDWSRARMKEALASCKGRLSEAVIRYDLYFHTLGDNFLVKVDRASMAHALEVRCPFLDSRFLGYEAKLPVEWKTDWSKRKILMRQVIKGLVPPSIVNRGKKGFEPPLKEWVHSPRHEKEFRHGLERLHALGIISDEWKEFYDGKVSHCRNMVLDVYRIRLLLLVKWMEYWNQDMWTAKGERKVRKRS